MFTKRKSALITPEEPRLIKSRRNLMLPAAMGAAALLVGKANAQAPFPSLPDLGLDDPTNASGLGTPAIIRGTVYAHLAAGVTVGAGQTTGTRQATATGLQNAINYAANNNKIFEIVPGVYEINSSAGLIIPANSSDQTTGFTWRGSRAGSQINQYYNGGSGAPILTIGDTTGATLLSHLDFDGVQLNYLSSQTGLTSSQALLLGSVAWGKMNSLSMNPGSSLSPCYDAVVWKQNAFSMSYSDWDIAVAQHTFLNVGNASTGSVWSNIYLNNGGPGNTNTITGNYLVIGTATGQENKFCQLNCEWGSINQLISIQGDFGIVFEDLHIEGITLVGSFPQLISFSNSAVHFDTLDIVNLICLSANFTSGPAVIINDYAPSPSNITISNFLLAYNTSSEINTALQLYRISALGGANHGTLTIDKGVFQDQTGTGQMNGNVSIDAHMPVGAARFLVPQRFSNYEWGVSGSTLKGAVIPVSATYTHYGQLVDATLIVPASITSFQITLADTMGATGTQLPTTGSRLHITRESGSASGTLTVKDGAGATLATNTTSNVELDFQFNGTAWVTFTGVT